MITLILVSAVSGLDCHPQQQHGWYLAPDRQPVYYGPYRVGPAPMTWAPPEFRAPSTIWSSVPATSGAPAPATTPPTTARPATLYERLGGEPAIKAVLDDFVARAAANPRVNFTRRGTDHEWEATPENIAHLKARLAELIGSATGGPQAYQGRSMKAAHQGMRIAGREFDALAGDLQVTLAKFKVPAREQAELLKIVGSTRNDIVEAP